MDNTLEELESLEQQILALELEMEQFAFDAIKLNELYKEKMILEDQYELLVSKMQNVALI